MLLQGAFFEKQRHSRGRFGYVNIHGNEVREI